MAKVNIDIFSWNLVSDGSLESYHAIWYNEDTKIKDGCSYNGDFGYGRGSENLQEIAELFLYHKAMHNLEKSDNVISLLEGDWPLKGPREKQKGYRYTQKPIEKIKDELESLLNDPKLILEGKKLAEKVKKNPPEIHYF